MKRRLIIAGVLIALVAGFVFWFRATFELVPGKSYVGASGEARLRPFLAAERFAERMGYAVSELRSLPEVDALKAGGVLLLPARRQTLDTPRIDRILIWVQAGGHLVVEAEREGVPDPLLDLLAVRRVKAPVAPAPLRVESPDARASYNVVMRPAFGLEAPGGKQVLRAVSDDKLRLVSFARGRGLVTVATSLDFARNLEIGEADHAAFVWHLLSSAPTRELRVYMRPQRLSLWGFLKDNAAPALIALAALLVAWLWRTAPRFGPVAPDAPPARRRLLDHLRASGRYFWSQGLRERLVIAGRDAALRRVARAQPEFAVARGAERAERLAALVAVSSAEAERLLNAGGAMRGAAFIQVMSTAQRVHAALERGNK